MSASWLQAQAQRLPTGKKPGWDDWCFEHMRLWPWPLWRMLAAFFDAVEASSLIVFVILVTVTIIIAVRIPPPTSAVNDCP